MDFGKIIINCIDFLNAVKRINANDIDITLINDVVSDYLEVNTKDYETAVNTLANVYRV